MPFNQPQPQLGYFVELLFQVGSILDIAIPVLVVLALALFIWGLVIFIFSGGEEKLHEQAKNKMLWGILALFVIVSVWGLVHLLNQVTGVSQGALYTPPFVDF